MRTKLDNPKPRTYDSPQGITADSAASITHPSLERSKEYRASALGPGQTLHYPHNPHYNLPPQSQPPILSLGPRPANRATTITSLPHSPTESPRTVLEPLPLTNHTPRPSSDPALTFPSRHDGEPKPGPTTPTASAETTPAHPVAPTNRTNHPLSSPSGDAVKLPTDQTDPLLTLPISSWLPSFCHSKLNNRTFRLANLSPRSNHTGQSRNPLRFLDQGPGPVRKTTREGYHKHAECSVEFPRNAFLIFGSRGTPSLGVLLTV